MKNNKKIFLTLFIVLVGSIIAYSFVSKRNTRNVETVKDKQKSEVKVTKSKLIPPPTADIIGIWVDEDEPGHKFEFSTDGTVKIYSQNVVVLSSTFEITDTCDGQTFDGNYLKIINDDDGTDMCFYIHGINVDNSGILSITPSGTSSLQTYQKQ